MTFLSIRDLPTGAEEEINRLKETLAATSHEIEQIKEDFADCADKLQYAEKLLDKAKTDFRDKNSRIKALEAHLTESRNEISRLTRQLDYFKEESESVQEELKHAYELRHEPSRTGRAPTALLPSRTGSPVPGLTREQKTEGVVLKHSAAPSEELYITTEPKESAEASHRSSHGLDLKDLESSPETLANATPACQTAKISKLICKILISIWKCDLMLRTKINSIYSERHPVLKCVASLTGSLLTQRLIITWPWVRSRLSGCPGDETRTSRASSSLLQSTQTSILWNLQWIWHGRWTEL